MSLSNVLCKRVWQFPRSTVCGAAHVLSSKVIPSADIQWRGLKDQIKARGIEWKQPIKKKFYDPERTGDLSPFDPPDKTRPVLHMLPALEEYDEAPIKVQQLLSIEFAPRNHLLTVAKYDVMRRVQRHQYDTGSLETQVAKFTAYIRYMQSEENTAFLNNSGRLRAHLNIIINRRKKYLRYIRNFDYKKFEWLLEELDIIYRPRPLDIGTIYRFDSLRKLVKMHCTNLREAKLKAYKEKLNAQRPAFLRKKVEVLKWIKDTEERLGVAITVDVEKGMIKPKIERPPTVWDRIFGPFIDDPPLRDFDWQYPEDWLKEYEAICKEEGIKKHGDDSRQDEKASSSNN